MAPRKNSKSKKNPALLLPAFVLGGIVALSFIITLSLSDTMLTTGSSAQEGFSCGKTCRRDSQCGAGLTCKPKGNTITKYCTCGTGNCIQGQCIASLGRATEGQECYLQNTQDAKLGKRTMTDYELAYACVDGLQCSYISYSGYRCTK